MLLTSELQSLPGNVIRFTGLPGELVSERDALGLCGHDVVEFRALLQKFRRGVDGHLNIAKDDEAGNVQVRVDLADGKLTGQARHVQFIILAFFHGLILL